MRVFINNRNYLTWPRAMAEILSAQGHEVLIVDNGSDYPELLEWYKDCPFEVFQFANRGCNAVWANGLVDRQKEPFVVTDPDLDISMIPADWPEALLEGLSRYPDALKCGFSLDESQVPPENPAFHADEMDKYPNGNPRVWGNAVALKGGFFNYPIGLTFAVYRPGAPSRPAGIRKGRPYTCRHLPWHITLDGKTQDNSKLAIPFDDEIAYYFSHCQCGYTVRRIEQMLKDYLCLGMKK